MVLALLLFFCSFCAEEKTLCEKGTVFIRSPFLLLAPILFRAELLNLLAKTLTRFINLNEAKLNADCQGGHCINLRLWECNELKAGLCSQLFNRCKIGCIIYLSRTMRLCSLAHLQDFVCMHKRKGEWERLQFKTRFFWSNFVGQNYQYFRVLYNGVFFNKIYFFPSN